MKQKPGTEGRDRHLFGLEPRGRRGRGRWSPYTGALPPTMPVFCPYGRGWWKSCSRQGLIKVVFATETLAAGINMPARTTVIASLSKRTDSGHRLLTPSEFLQMAGRAGRRGMDDRGHVVTVETPFEGPRKPLSGYGGTRPAGEPVHPQLRHGAQPAANPYPRGGPT
jgi:hypothetical protein